MLQIAQIDREIGRLVDDRDAGRVDPLAYVERMRVIERTVAAYLSALADRDLDASAVDQPYRMEIASCQ